MANARDFKKRIISVKNTQKTTKAMKMVAAAKLRKAQHAILAQRPYALKLREILQGIATRTDILSHPLLARRPVRRARIIVLTSNRGLCGSFNTSVLRNSLLFIEENKSSYDEFDMSFIGRRGHDFFKKRSFKIHRNYEDVVDNITYEKASDIAGHLIDEYKSENLDAVYFIYNEFKSAILQKLTIEEVLPISRKEIGDGQTVVDYLYEPNKEKILDDILPRHVCVQVYRMLLESAASEHGARMTAMDSATRNAGDMIEKLTLLANRMRQQSITTELVEIISGAEAS